MKIQGQGLIVYYEPRSSPIKNKVRIVVGVKVSKKAVGRNRIRRQIKEIIRHYEKHGNFLAGGLRVVALPQILGGKFSEIKQDLEDVLNKIK